MKTNCWSKIVLRQKLIFSIENNGVTYALDFFDPISILSPSEKIYEMHGIYSYGCQLVKYFSSDLVISKRGKLGVIFKKMSNFNFKKVDRCKKHIILYKFI